MVYALRECSGLVVAAVFLLPWRRMVQGVFPAKDRVFVLGLTYLTVLLGLNRILPLIDRQENAGSASGGADHTL